MSDNAAPDTPTPTTPWPWGRHCTPSTPRRRRPSPPTSSTARSAGAPSRRRSRSWVGWPRPWFPSTPRPTCAGALVGLVVNGGTDPRVLTTGIPANPSDEIYVLWGLADGAPRALATFDVTGAAPTVRSVPSSTEAAPYAGFAVSIEPGRTAPASPTRIVASGQVGR